MFVVIILDCHTAVGGSNKEMLIQSSIGKGFEGIEQECYCKYILQ